jgi:hypothetical protein
MRDVSDAIGAVRDSVCALLRISPAGEPGKFNLAIVGTTWCITPGRVFLTAHHVLNGGNPRDASDRFHVLSAPGNGHSLYHWPVSGFLLEDAARDLVLFEAPVPADRKIEVSAIPISVTPPPDGTPVLTYGCPAPAIARATVSEQGNLTAIQTILFTHANTGIVAAQYRMSPSMDLLFELSVGWHHGESGGPVLRLEPEVAAFAVMQHYRNIQGPHGTMAGPRRGLALASIREELRNAGASLVEAP